MIRRMFLREHLLDSCLGRYYAIEVQSNDGHFEQEVLVMTPEKARELFEAGYMFARNNKQLDNSFSEYHRYREAMDKFLEQKMKK